MLLLDMISIIVFWKMVIYRFKFVFKYIIINRVSIMYKKKGKVRKFVICVSVVVCLLLSSVFINRRFNLPNFFIKDGILYLDRMLVKSFSFLNGNDYNELKSENERLNNEINMLKHYEVENEELTSQISKLKGLLKIDKLLSDKEFINSCRSLYRKILRK